MTGCKGRPANIIKSFFLREGELEKFNLQLQKKYRLIAQKEERQESLFLDDARIVLVAYGTMARISRGVVKALRKKGRKIGFIRPISLWPFPEKIFKRLARKKKRITFLVTEMSYGQMLEDVKLALNGAHAVEFIGRSGGGIPSEEEIMRRLSRIKR